MNSPYFMLFGDIHNHNAMGYGVGTLERSIEVARGHLDFFAFTGHSSWHDMKAMEGGRENHWLNGFEVLANGWPKVQDLIAAAINDAVHKIEKSNQAAMQEMTSGLNLPPGFKMPF